MGAIPDVNRIALDFIVIGDTSRELVLVGLQFQFSLGYAN